MKKSIFAAMSLVLTLAVGLSAQAQIKIHTGFPGGSYYEMATDIEDLVNTGNRQRVELDTQYIRQNPKRGEKVVAENFSYEAQIVKDTVILGDLVKVSSSRGSIENFERLSRQRESFQPTLGFIQYDVLVSKQLKDMKNRTSFTTNFRVIFPAGKEVVHLLVKKDSKIKTLGDLNNKKMKVAIGHAEAGTNYTAKLIEETLGFEWEDVEDLSVDGELAQLLNGDIDALFFVSATPVGYFDKRALKAELRMLPIEDARLEDYYEPAVVKADTYDWMDEDVKTVTVESLLVSANSQTDYNGAYDLEELMRAIKDNIETLRRKGHANWKNIDFSYDDVDWEIHRMAKKYLMD